MQKRAEIRAQVIDVGNALAQKVELVPATSPLAPSLARAEASIAGMTQGYCRALANDIVEMETLLARLAAPAGDGCEGELKRLSDIVFNIKGQAGTFQYELITRIAADLHRLLQCVKLNETGAVGIIRHHLAAMQVVLDRELLGLGGDMGERLLATLSRAPG